MNKKYPDGKSPWKNKEFKKKYCEAWRRARGILPRSSPGSVNCCTCKRSIIINTLSKHQLKRKFCSIKCYRDHQRSGAYITEGTKITGNGYILVRKTDHPNANKRGYVYEHRLVMEEKIGRFLTVNEVVHHINGIKTDNRPENLNLFSTTSEHTSYHGYRGDLRAKKRKN